LPTVIVLTVGNNADGIRNDAMEKDWADRLERHFLGSKQET